jgi:hypothetical protein
MHQGGYPAAFPQQPVAHPYPDNVPSAYPGMLPPPVPYRRRRKWPIIAGAVLALAVVAALVTAIVFAGRGGQGGASGTLTESSAKAAIQQYLDAMTNGDYETVARHALCGLFDAVKERRSDLALANLSADAFRKQYSRAEVTSIDKMVMWSPHQAQVLFSMRVTPASGSRRDQQSPKEEQAVAQILAEDNETLVCSYLPRTAGQY